MRVHFLFLSARQANPYPHGFSMHTEGIMPFLHVNRRAWKQTHWISGAFLFYILINLKAVIKSSFVWDVPCANAYLVPNSPLPVFLYKYKQNNLKKKKQLDNFQFQAATNSWTSQTWASCHISFSCSIHRKPFSVQLEEKTRVGFHVALIRGGGKG